MAGLVFFLAARNPAFCVTCGNDVRACVLIFFLSLSLIPLLSARPSPGRAGMGCSLFEVEAGREQGRGRFASGEAPGGVCLSVTEARRQGGREGLAAGYPRRREGRVSMQCAVQRAVCS